MSELTYRAAHHHIEAVLGPASGYLCHDCRRRPACEWAYVGGAPDETRDERGRGYSGDPSFYRPLDRSYHRRRDRKATQQAELSGPCCSATDSQCRALADIGRRCCDVYPCTHVG